MDEIAQKIELYHNLFLGCLALSILCIVIAGILFFVLDIRSVLGYLTGRSAKKQIQALKEANEASGRLIPRERSNMQYVAQEMKQDMGVRSAVVPGARKVENIVQKMPSEYEDASTDIGTAVLSGNEETTLLKEKAESEETTLLAHADKKQEVPNALTADGSTEVLLEDAGPPGNFRIEREIIRIHTEEVI